MTEIEIEKQKQKQFDEECFLREWLDHDVGGMDAEWSESEDTFEGDDDYEV
jgi:hypothetical protein